MAGLRPADHGKAVWRREKTARQILCPDSHNIRVGARLVSEFHARDGRTGGRLRMGVAVQVAAPDAPCPDCEPCALGRPCFRVDADIRLPE